MGERGTLSLRARMVLLGMVGATVLLVVGGLLMGQAVSAALERNVEAATVQRARDLAIAARRAALPSRIDVVGDDEALVQVVGPDGAIVARSDNIAGARALRVPRPSAGDTRVTRVARLPIDDEAAGYLVASTTVAARAGPTTVHVAATLGDVSETVVAATDAAAVALPVLVVILAVALWILVDRTLAPVAAITAEADGIGAQQLHRRVPEPARRDEIGRLARTINGMLGRLEDAARRQRRFVADASHELRAPITSLRAQLETAREQGGNADWEAASRSLLDDTVRMQHLAEQLLLLARLEREGFAPRRRPVDLDDVVDHVIDARNGDRSAIDVSRVWPVQVWADQTLLARVVANLVDNAARHATSAVRITTAARDGKALLEIEDDGPGIPSPQRVRILEPFTRVDDARDRGRGGAGLGLAIVHDIVTAHGGQLVIGDSDLGGALLRITLPVDGD